MFIWILGNDDVSRAVVFAAEGTDNFSVGMNLKQLFSALEVMGGAGSLLNRR